MSQMFARVLMCLCIIALGPFAHAQVVAPSNEENALTVPDALTPEIVDSMMARLTDAEIRALLRDELVRRAEAEAETDSDLMMSIDQVQARLDEMSNTIERRVTRWVKAVGNLSNRRDEVAARLARAERGIQGMLVSSIGLLAAGIGAAWLVGWLMRSWREWLKTPTHESYWNRLVRSLVLGFLDILPIFAFLVTTGFLAPVLAPRLGPLIDYQWIFQAGISWSWAFIVFTRRAFAPDAPAIRIAPLSDDLANRLHQLLRGAVRIGAAGWLIGGLILHLGLGFPPVMIMRALAGTAVAIMLLTGLWINRDRIRKATAFVFEPGRGALGTVLVAAAPAGLAAYIVVAWLYWLAHWLETGQDRLGGPAGTLIVYLALPILDRMGREVVESLIRSETDTAERFRGVFRGAWRLIVGLAGILIVAGLWGVDILALAKGPNASGWASTLFDIVVTVMLGYLAWRMVIAALHTERRASVGAEDVDPSTVPAASRLDTLVPLFRNFLLAVVAVVITMIVLSAVGVDVGPLIASAGIIGIAIGFGAQSLVRDVFSGIFFLVDDAFRVGEYIELDADMRGEVEAISVRSLKLRHHKGAVITIPFGELKAITNHNRDWVIYKMSFRMEPDTDPKKFKKLVKEVGKEFLAHPEHGPKFIEPLKSQGVYYVDDDSALVMRVKFKCKPRAQFVLRREIYHRLREVFAENDLSLARRKVEVVGPEDASLDAATRGAIPDEVLNPAAGTTTA